MPKAKSSTKDEKASPPSSGPKVLVVTTIITALVGLIGTVATVYIQDVYRPSLWAKLTQTAQVSFQQEVCPPAPERSSPTEVAILTQYVNADQVSVYSEKDQSIKPFQTLYRGDAVEVLDNVDPVWSCITYSRGDVRVYGYVLRDQLLFGFSITETAIANTNPAVPVSQTATTTP